MSGLLIAVLVAASIFEFINGFHDTANAIATTVYTRALPPRVAILCSACMNFLGALMSESVALTIATGLVAVKLDLYVILAALMGAIIWDLFTWWRAIPSSSSHALIGSLIGATIVYTRGTSSVIWTGVTENMHYKTNSLVMRYVPPTTSASWKAHAGGADTFFGKNKGRTMEAKL